MCCQVEVITRPEEAYWLWCVVVCVLETSWIRRPWPTGGLLLEIKKKAPKIIQCQAQFRVLLSMWLKCYVFSGYEFSVVYVYCYFEAISHILIFEELIFKTYNTLFRLQLGIFTEYWGINRCTKKNRNYVTYRFVPTLHLTAVVVPSWHTRGPHRASFSIDESVVAEVSLKVSSLIIGWLEC
jgi:hypothetical protein